ncbi:hypothetical protein BFN10_13450 [Pseudomonas extremorientalis]|uniref:Uncharacterized protein n=1 Tax=Pseudomonas extremorientalis TaxID=169669 RepID=A0A1S2TJB4_9PSED|nr:hypothetical protein BFN10_13450 [Pseudomonas extremorientalis]
MLTNGACQSTQQLLTHPIREQARSHQGSSQARDQCMKIAIRMITGIGTPRNQSSNERMLFSLN